MKPKVGMTVTYCGGTYRIFRIHPFGTIDIEEIDGPRAWRITGLSF